MPDETPPPPPPDRDPSGDPAYDPTRVVPPVAPPDDRSPAAESPGLYRSTHDRMLAGVCGGIAERYGIETVLVRLAFLASLLIGGAGVLFYVAAAIVIPNPPGDPAVPRTPSTSGNVVGGVIQMLVALALGFVALVALLVVAGASFATTIFFGAWPAATVLVLLGVLLAFVARHGRSAATVLVLLVAIAVPAAFAVASDVSIDRSFGDRSMTPITREEAAEGYRLGAGDLTVDLRELPLAAGDRPLTVPVRVGFGRATVIVPAKRCVAWTIRTRIRGGGDVRILELQRGEQWVGSPQPQVFRIDPGGKRRPRVTVDVQVTAGQIVFADSYGGAISPRRPSIDRSTGNTIRTGTCGDSEARRP